MEALHVWDNHGGCKSRIDFKLRINTDHFKLILKRYNSHRGRALLRSLSISTSPVIKVVRCLKNIPNFPKNCNKNSRKTQVYLTTFITGDVVIERLLNKALPL